MTVAQMDLARDTYPLQETRRAQVVRMRRRP